MRNLGILILLFGILSPSFGTDSSSIISESSEEMMSSSDGLDRGPERISLENSNSDKKFARYPGINLPEGRGASSSFSSPSSSSDIPESSVIGKEESKTRRMKLLELRRKQIEELRRLHSEQIERKAEEEDDDEEEQDETLDPYQLELEMLRSFKSEWQQYRPQSYFPPATFFPTAPYLDERYCSCNYPPPPSPSIARTLSPDEEDEEPEDSYIYPVPNRPRYMKPFNLPSSRNKRHKRSVKYDDSYIHDYDVDAYWYDQGSENKVLKRVNLGYLANTNYKRRLPHYLLPLHFGTIPKYDFNYYDKHAFHRSRKNKKGYH